MVVHMLRVFFTGAYRKPREINWMIGLGLLMLGIIEGFAGYSLPDDLLSGTGLRFVDGLMRSIPIVEPEAVHSIGLVVPDREPMQPLTAALVAEAKLLAERLR